MAYEHGKMNVTEQEKTFHGFLRAVFTVGAISIGVLIFLALSNS